MSTSPSTTKPPPTQARVKLPPDQFEEVRITARSLGLPLSTFMRLAIIEKVRRLKEGKE